MKIFIGTAMLLITTFNVSAQSVDDGKRHIYYERFESAKNVFHAVLKNNPSNAEAWFWLTRSYVLSGDTAAAIDTLVRVPGTVLLEPYYQVATGALFLDNNRVSEAKAAFAKAITITKEKDAGILQAIADAEITSDSGDGVYAVELLQRAIKRDKRNAALFVSLGRAYRKLHDGGKAYQAFYEAIDKDKRSAAAHYELGRIFLTQKNAEMYINHFMKAIQADQGYAPAYYALYDHYLYTDPSKAAEYFRQYTANADASLQQQYSYTDLVYLEKKYDSAIALAKQLVMQEGDKVQPRLYKLIAYSYQEKSDSGNALNYMQQYFAKGIDTNFIAKDFETMSGLFGRVPGKEDSSVYYLEKALELTTDEDSKAKYYQQLASLTKVLNDFAGEARWLGMIYSSGANANNVTLFNWGLAAYKAKDYIQADSVFAKYMEKYPEQGYGYYWRARSNAAIDTTMQQGLAIPHYEKLVEVLDKDSLTATDKKWMKEAYGYLAGYEANIEKDYPGAIDYFEQLLEIDPANDQARKYIEILEKNMEIKNKNAAAGSN